MLPLLVYIFFKKYSRTNRDEASKLLLPFLNPLFQVMLAGIVILLLSLIPLLSKAQSRQLNYKIVKGGDDIGWMRLEKNTSGNKSSLSMVSEINTRFIFSISVSAKESSAYENGRLTYSSLFRKNNGDVKVDKQIRFTANKYEVTENGEKKDLPVTSISTNLLSLYFHEPTNTSFVYCEKQECFVGLLKTADGGYKIKFPDGNSNCYYYAGGVCTRIEISHTFYSASIILNN